MPVEPRKRRRLLLALVGLVALVAGVWLFLNHDPEPTYKSRKLSEWSAIFFAAPTFPEVKEAEFAIQTIGTNALPYLLEWMTYDPGDLRRQAWMYVDDLPNWLQNSSVIRKWLYSGMERTLHVQTAFTALGDQAIPAIPELHRLACTVGKPETQIMAVHCLFSIGPAAAPALTNVLATAGIAAEPWVTKRLKGLGANATPFVPILVEHLKHGETRTAIASAETLAALRLDPDVVISALIEGTSNPNQEARRAVVKALSAFGLKATSALPALTNLLSNPDPDIRSAAAAAIAAIDTQLQK